MLDPLSHLFVRSAGTGSDAARRGPLILVYHGTPSATKRDGCKFSVAAADFALHLDMLCEFGWHTAYVRDLAGAAALPEKTVIITFDDGFADNYSNAFLPLKERNMRATWFVVSQRIGSCADWMGEPRLQLPTMGIAELRELAASGMEIGSHTRTHADLTTLSSSQLDEQISGSRQDLEDALGGEVTSFAYPFGRSSPATVEAVGKAGYRFACLTKPGWFGSSAGPLELRRITLTSSDTVGTFARNLFFADNSVSWIRGLKYALGRINVRTARPPGTA